MTPTRHASWALLFLVLSALWPASAYAHPQDTSFRLGLGIPLLAVTHYPEPDSTSITYGLYPITFGVHLGVQITSEVGIAVHVLGGGRYDNVAGVDTHLVLFSVVPRFEYMFTPHDTVGVYLGLEAGVDVNGLTGTNLSDVFRTGPFFGLHIFAVTEFSVDLELAGNLLYDIDADQLGVRGVLYFSVTGWLT